MVQLRVLISGGGCAGPALAFWLAKAGHSVTVVERFPALRASGAQIDIRAQGIEVIRRMGLMEAIREKLVDEDGVALVDATGRPRATLLANKSGKGSQTVTSEFEIMRGDLVRVFYEETEKLGVEYVFGKTVDRFEQGDRHVTAYLSDGTSGVYDLLVGADGQASRTRRAILPPGADPYRHFGVYISYWTVPAAADDGDKLFRIHHVPGGRIVTLRRYTAAKMHAGFNLRDGDPALRDMPRGTPAQQKAFWESRFRGAGWAADRCLEGLRAADDFYCVEAVQVHAATWHRGRAVLLGDAAHCPTPLTGMGTTGCFVGAYVLAGELARSPDDVPAALARYEATLRPFVDEIQTLKPWILGLFFPRSAWVIAVLRFVVGVMCWLRLPDIAARLISEDRGGWKLPEYPELAASIEEASGSRGNAA